MPQRLQANKAIEMYPALSNDLAKKKDVNKSDTILIA